MKVVVLTGGRGTRLGLVDRPKAMVDVAGRPLLERLVDSAKESGLNEFVFLNGHLAEVIEGHFGDGSRFGVVIEHVREQTALGTAGAVLAARAHLTEPFFVIYGDILIDVDLRHFGDYAQKKGGLGTLFVHPNDHPADSDLVETDANGLIRGLLPKPHERDHYLPNLVSAALYVLHPKAINYIPAGRPSDWGTDVFPLVLEANEKLYAYRSLEYAKDVGTPDRLAKGVADLANGRVSRLSRKTPKPAVFLDRDGVLNEEIDGVYRPEDLRLCAGAAVAVRKLNQAGIPVICTTNQPALAKGRMTFDDLRQVFAALDTALAREGAYLDDVYFCPHHPERGWPGEVASLKVVCDCRKPAPGMLIKAADDHNLDLSRSWLIGDRQSDVEAARAAGANAILLQADNGSKANLPGESIVAAIDRVLRTLL